MINSKTKKLNKFFNPKSVAIIGASDEIKTVGLGLVKNISLFKGDVFYVNPFDKKIANQESFAKITDIKKNIDLVIIAVPAKIVLEIVKDCCEKKVGGLVIISSGFAEAGEEGKKIQNKIVELVSRAGIPLIGPNCLGIISTQNNLNASFAPLHPKTGNITFLSQSGSIIDAVLDKSADENFGFSKIVSYGNEADVSLVDFLEYFQNDKQTKVIGIYLESIKDGQKFMTIAKKVSKIKPIVIIKSGKTISGQKAATTHTGALSTDYEIYKAAFKQAGIIQTESLQDFFDKLKALCFQPVAENGFGIITNGGGLGVLAADFCEEMGIILPEISKKSIISLDKDVRLKLLPTKKNPLDLMGDALPERYKIAIKTMLGQDNIKGLLVMQAIQIMTDPMENAKIIVELHKQFPNKPIVSCFVGKKLAQEAIDYLEKNKIPNYNDPKRAIQAISSLIIKK